LWEERYKSVLVEGDEKALMTVAAYIDLNPIRADIVQRQLKIPSTTIRMAHLRAGGMGSICLGSFIRR
jgi:hypothetical protein